jgi:hypothetical protein
MPVHRSKCTRHLLTRSVSRREPESSNRSISIVSKRKRPHRFGSALQPRASSPSLSALTCTSCCCSRALTGTGTRLAESTYATQHHAKLLQLLIVHLPGPFAHSIWFAMRRRVPRVWRATLNKMATYGNYPASDSGVRRQSAAIARDFSDRDCFGVDRESSMFVKLLHQSCYVAQSCFVFVHTMVWGTEAGSPHLRPRRPYSAPQNAERVLIVQTHISITYIFIFTTQSPSRT